MNYQYTVLVYSEFSTHCKKILDIMKNSDVDFTNAVTLHPLCIDNPSIRNKILSDKKLEIKYVPCILCIYEGGVVEKFDGISAFEWVNEIIEKLKPQQKNKDVIGTKPLPVNQEPEITEEKSHIVMFDDNEEDDDNNTQDSPPIPLFQHPKHLVRSNEGNYEMTDMTMDKPPETNVTSRVKKSGKKSDIKSVAEEMAKQRENEIKAESPYSKLNQ